MLPVRSAQSNAGAQVDVPPGSTQENAHARVNLQAGRCVTRRLNYVQCACASELATRCATRGLKLVQCACANGCGREKGVVCGI